MISRGAAWAGVASEKWRKRLLARSVSWLRAARTPIPWADYIRNKARGDDNSGQGYRIVAVDDESDILTLSAAPTGWQAGDALHPWLPSAKPIGTALESRFGNVEIDGKVGKMNEGSLTISCPVTNLEENG